MEKSTWSAWTRALGLFATIVTEIVAGTVAGILVGYGATRYLDWPSVVMIFTGLAGFSLGLFRVVKAANRLTEETDRDNETRS